MPLKLWNLLLWLYDTILATYYAIHLSQLGIIIMKTLLQLGQKLNHLDHWLIQGGQSGIGNLAGSAILVLLTSLFVFDNGQRAECRSGGRAVRDGRWVVRGACCANTESWRKNGKQNRLYDLSLLFHISKGNVIRQSLQCFWCKILLANYTTKFSKSLSNQGAPAAGRHAACRRAVKVKDPVLWMGGGDNYPPSEPKLPQWPNFAPSKSEHCIENNGPCPPPSPRQ